MKLKANSIVKLVVGTAAAVTAVIAANSFATSDVVVAEENSTTYQQSEQFTTEDGSHVTVFESQPVYGQSDDSKPDSATESSGLGSSELVIVDEGR